MADELNTGPADIISKAEAVESSNKKYLVIALIPILIGLSIAVFLTWKSGLFSTNDIPPDTINNNSADSTIDLANTANANATDNISSSGTSCEENWNCTNWTKCDSGLKLRNCTDINDCITEINKPETTQDCCKWVCEPWSDCYPHNVTLRVCDIPDECSEEDRPETMKECGYANLCTDTETNTSYTDKGTVTDKYGVEWKDTCEDKYTLDEMFCAQLGEVDSEIITCPEFCEAGE